MAKAPRDHRRVFLGSVGASGAIPTGWLWPPTWARYVQISFRSRPRSVPRRSMSGRSSARREAATPGSSGGRLSLRLLMESHSRPTRGRARGGITTRATRMTRRRQQHLLEAPATPRHARVDDSNSGSNVGIDPEELEHFAIRRRRVANELLEDDHLHLIAPERVHVALDLLGVAAHGAVLKSAVTLRASGGIRRPFRRSSSAASASVKSGCPPSRA